MTFDHGNHPLVRAACYNLKEQQKTIPLDNHAGPHSEPYHTEIRRRLDAKWSMMGSGRSVGEYTRAVDEVVDGISRDIVNGTLHPYSNKIVTPAAGRVDIEIKASRSSNGGRAVGRSLVVLNIVEIVRSIIEFAAYTQHPGPYTMQPAPGQGLIYNVYDSHGNVVGQYDPVY